MEFYLRLPDVFAADDERKAGDADGDADGDTGAAREVLLGHGESHLQHAAMRTGRGMRRGLRRARRARERAVQRARASASGSNWYFVVGRAIYRAGSLPVAAVHGPVATCMLQVKFTPPDM